MGNCNLNFEELTTVLYQIAAILNSRPLCPLSSDPSDLSVLTPAHFLIGDSLLAIPEPSIMHIDINRLSRWQLLERLRQHFWRRWHKEYLSSLQQRTKWKTQPSTEIKINDLVLIKEENIPPLCWPMGRVEKLHEGNDGITRVATIKTAKGISKRTIRNLCLLPLKEQKENR